MKLTFEKYYPILFGVIVSVLWYRLGWKLPESDAVISSTLSVAGIFVGFLATAKAILMSMSSTIIDDLKESGYINELVSYIGQAIWINLFFCVVNVIGYFSIQSSDVYGLLWAFFATSSLIAFVRVTDIMLKVFKYS